MYAGISGMKNFQTKLDVIGNNIANVNTSGFKKGRATFQEMMSQMTSGAQGPTETRGGVNAAQVGLGSQLGSIDNIHTQGSRQTTNNPLDFALEGDGMFAVRDGEMTAYTRAGNFYLDEDGSIVNSEGAYLLGFPSEQEIDARQVTTWDSAGNPLIISTDPITGNKTVSAINEDGEEINYQIEFGENDAGEDIMSVMKVYEDGTEKDLGSFTKNVDNEFELEVFKDQGGEDIVVKFSDNEDHDPIIEINGVSKTFSTDGNENTELDLEEEIEINYSNDANSVSPISITTAQDGTMTLTADSASQTFKLDEETGTLSAEVGGVTVTLDGAVMSIKEVDGADKVIADETTNFMREDAVLEEVINYDDMENPTTLNIPDTAQSFSVQSDGTITYVDEFGDNRIAGQIAVANFSNPAGLEKAGSNLFLNSANAGFNGFSIPESEGTASIVSGSLEMSNVDLSEEFTEMITAQRGFQANTRIITTSDEILQELVNLKR
nr:flagellar basal-body rod protein FlgF [Oceanobacillus limi]